MPSVFAVIIAKVSSACPKLLVILARNHSNEDSLLIFFYCKIHISNYLSCNLLLSKNSFFAINSLGNFWSNCAQQGTILAQVPSTGAHVAKVLYWVESNVVFYAIHAHLNIFFLTKLQAFGEKLIFLLKQLKLAVYCKWMHH